MLNLRIKQCSLRPAHRLLPRTTASAIMPDSSAFTIVGGGRVGQALMDMGTGQDVLVRRGESVQGPPLPIIVCTRNEELQQVVDETPRDLRQHLVFIQNGMLQPWLERNHLANNTQVLVYFAVAKKGDSPTDGKTDLNPEGLTAAWGQHAEVVAARLHRGGLSCKVLNREEFQKAMLEKLIWICAFMLIGAKHKVTVGEVERDYRGDVSALIDELASAGARELGVRLDWGVVDRLCAYARSVSHFPTAVKEFSWRNGWFYDITTRARQQGLQDPCPQHTALLREVVNVQ